MRRQGAEDAAILTAADPFGSPTCEQANALRRALLVAQLEAAEIPFLRVSGEEGVEDSADTSYALPKADDALVDDLLVAHEQLAAVRLQQGQPANLWLHPALR